MRFVSPQPGGVIDNPYGVICVDRFGLNAILLAQFVVLLMLSGAAGAYIGPGLSPIRGTLGTVIGEYIYSIYMMVPPDVSITFGMKDVMMSCLTAVFAYAGGWMITRYLSMRQTRGVGRS